MEDLEDRFLKQGHQANKSNTIEAFNNLHCNKNYIIIYKRLQKLLKIQDVTFELEKKCQITRGHLMEITSNKIYFKDPFLLIIIIK